jgi:hypothetical protein
MDSTPHPVEKVAVVLAAGLAAGEAGNVSACIAAGLAAAAPGWAGEPLLDADGLRSAASSHLPITVLMADGPRMERLLQELAAERPPGAAAVLFPAYAQRIQEAPTYWAQHRAVSHRGQRLLGLGVAGSRKWVNRLTGSLPLLR